MLFNSYAFLFAFVPIAFLGYIVCSRFKAIYSVTWLSICSLTFYGIWNPAFLTLLLGSIAFNYLCGYYIGKIKGDGRKLVFTFAVFANLLALGIFKYLGPFIEFSSRYGLLKDLTWLHIILPLGISFFTFTQIGFLVDRLNGLADDLDPIRYTLFVTFFPHLIAGPILHVRDIGPQIVDPDTFKPKLAKIGPGLSLFILGLAKKVLIADPLAGTVAFGFGHPTELSMIEGWLTAITYTMQLYFDFSGYSDMAIGLAGIFGFRFPVNFNSPYKSRSIIEFWKRWHITLSNYIQILLYSPIALMITRRRVAKGLKVSAKALKSPWVFLSLLVTPTLVTMGIAGIWHGAGLQFLIFGLLHGFYLCVNHAFRVYGNGSVADNAAERSTFDALWKVGLTFIAAMFAFVFFRSVSVLSAVQLMSSMFGAHGLGLPHELSHILHVPPKFHHELISDNDNHVITANSIIRLIVCFGLVWFVPNTQQWLGSYSPTLEGFTLYKWRVARWQPNILWAVFLAVLLWAAVMNFNQSTTFLYFQF